MVVFAMSSAGACTLLNPLDYLKAGRNAGEADGAAVTDAIEDAEDPNAPGCPPERWTTCGVTVLVDGGTPTAVVADSSGRAFFADPASGSIAETRCTPSSCMPVLTWVVDEPELRQFAWSWLDVVWTTSTEVRTAEVFGNLEAGRPPVRTIAAAQNPSAVHSGSYFTTWADDQGVHYFQVNRSVVNPFDVQALLSPRRATALFARSSTVYFVSGGELFTCALDTTTYDRCVAEPTAMEGVRDPLLLGEANGFASGDAGGLLATRAAEGGTEIALIEQVDAGALPVVMREAAEIVSLSGSGRDIWFTTSSGVLRRRTVSVPEVVTVLRGLGPRASVAAALDQVYVADPDLHVVLHVVR